MNTAGDGAQQSALGTLCPKTEVRLQESLIWEKRIADRSLSKFITPNCGVLGKCKSIGFPW